MNLFDAVVIPISSGELDRKVFSALWFFGFDLIRLAASSL